MQTAENSYLQKFHANVTANACLLRILCPRYRAYKILPCEKNVLLVLKSLAHTAAFSSTRYKCANQDSFFKILPRCKSWKYSFIHTIQILKQFYL